MNLRTSALQLHVLHVDRKTLPPPTEEDLPPSEEVGDTHLSLHGGGQLIVFAGLILCSLHQPVLHHLLHQCVVIIKKPQRTPWRNSILQMLRPPLILLLLLLDGGHSAPQDLQMFSRGRVWGEGALNGCPDLVSQSGEVLLQMHLLLTDGLPAEELLLSEDQTPADHLQLTLLLLLLLLRLHLLCTVQLSIYRRSTREGLNIIKSDMKHLLQVPATEGGSSVESRFSGLPT